MALSNAEKKRVLELLDRASEQEKETILEGVRSFMDWLEEAANTIWRKIRQSAEAAARFFDEIIDIIFNW